MANTQLLTNIPATVQTALTEDIGDGDITAQLIPVEQTAKARVISRQNAVICGTQWVNEVFHQVDKSVKVNWLVQDGDRVIADQPLFELEGSARSLLTGERCALNFLQTLSATATISSHYASLVEGTGVKLLDTRKTIPGLRNAQKYAVSCAGCFNHRIGLYDAFLIKENHIMACGSISNAVATAKHNEPGKPVEVEVESFDELMQALEAGADIIMLDNFDHAGLRLAVQKNKEHPTPAKLEASGGIDESTLRSIAETGVDYISIGLLTKDCKAVDLSMRFI
ncbi:carboxylating nicotinate-nucleotide diphosphorylase [Amphritea japonica]|uniref:Probable nicotinate-nucleotide pyrophosphorylase [carboxylating] n=1 Tax=Amphritea japonica ATCC BAA-1530 TaxID=1278309 RepID=A0A7R6PCE8_9GAMM|nr:carboxylating nicotinate-nucleotide diphosphorylase [Amphritea japonica]BBB25526.1 nicotinate-nucleotide pyrophosphorylase (carboxylating) [Amphritea japonica ATCC BAA-1530]